MKNLIALFLGLCLAVLFLGTLQADEKPQVTCTFVTHTASGYVKSGCVGLTLITSAGFTGTVGSTSLASSTTYPIPIPSGGRLNDFYYTVTGGSLITIEVR